MHTLTLLRACARTHTYKINTGEGGASFLFSWSNYLSSPKVEIFFSLHNHEFLSNQYVSPSVSVIVLHKITREITWHNSELYKAVVNVAPKPLNMHLSINVISLHSTVHLCASKLAWCSKLFKYPLFAQEILYLYIQGKWAFITEASSKYC